MNKIKIAAISDTHGSALPEIKEPVDVFIHAGDWNSRPPYSYYAQLQDLDSLLLGLFTQCVEFELTHPNEKLIKTIIINNGNHETLNDTTNPDHVGKQYISHLLDSVIEGWVTKFGNIGIKIIFAMKREDYMAHSCARIVEIEDLGTVLIVPYTSKINDPEVWGNLWTKATEEEVLDLIKNRNIDVIVSHGPPLGFADGTVLSNGSYKNRMGDQILLDIIVDKQPKMFICGHIHGANGTYEVGNGTTIYSVAHLDENYDPVNNIKYITYEK